MDTPSAMDKKAVNRVAQPSAKSGQDVLVPKDYGGKKTVPQNGRKRECDRPDPGRKPVAWRGGRQGQRYVRPREKMGGKVEGGGGVPESGSLYCAGGKKQQDITHLLDWWGPGHRAQGGGGGYRGAGRVRRYSSHAPKYSKEHYLQANCQFVVSESGDYSVYAASQDLLVDWGLVEEVRLHVSEAPSCPICLHPPTAAKVARCGHSFCFPCILHYLALSDKKWRKCPICYEPVEKDDLKSMISICHKEYGLGEEIEMTLMRRERDSLLPVPASQFTQELIKTMPRLSQPNAASNYTKLLTASKEEVQAHILAREQAELAVQLKEEGDQPEACFIHEAIALLHNRCDSITKNSSFSLERAEEGLESLSLSSADETLSSESLSSFEDLQSPTDAGATQPLSTMEVPGLVGGEECNKPGLSAEDLDISLLQPVDNSATANPSQKNAPKSTFYFYQASNGAHCYLHKLNVQMLVHEYGALEKCPPVIRARVVEKEPVSMTEELRMRLRYLKHLPVTCSFDVVEVALACPVVSKLTLASFQDQLESRQRKRNKRAKEERKIEKRVQQEEDRMLGRSKGANIKIQSLKQFPSFSDDFPPRTNSEAVESGVVSNEVNANEVTASPAEAAASSLDTCSPGISFAKMIREGQTKSVRPRSEPVDITPAKWPSLGSPTAWAQEPQNGQRSTGGQSWERKAGGGMQQHSSLSSSHNDSAEDEEGVAVPEFKHAFCHAMARALDAAAAKPTALAEEDGSEAGKKGKNKKKKQKKVLLFSSGGLK